MTYCYLNSIGQKFLERFYLPDRRLRYAGRFEILMDSLGSLGSLAQIPTLDDFLDQPNASRCCANPQIVPRGSDAARRLLGTFQESASMP